jgi:predicted DNA-binding protein (MmcQ/YjbR family)
VDATTDDCSSANSRRLTVPSRKPLKRAEAALRKVGLDFPEAVEDFPWGHTAIKVKGKIFLILGGNEGMLTVSLKLPLSNNVAVTLPFAAPTGYGLGKSGWVTASFTSDDEIPLDMLEEWIDESYRAIAPKRLVAVLDGSASPKPPSAPTPKRQKKAK